MAHTEPNNHALDEWMSCVTQGRVEAMKHLTVTVVEGKRRLHVSLPPSSTVNELRSTVQTFFEASGVRFFFIKSLGDPPSGEISCEYFQGEVESSRSAQPCTVDGKATMIQPCSSSSSTKPCHTLGDLWKNGGKAWDDSLVLYAQLRMDQEADVWAAPNVSRSLQKPSDYASLPEQLRLYIQRLQPSPTVS